MSCVVLGSIGVPGGGISGSCSLLTAPSGPCCSSLSGTSISSGLLVGTGGTVGTGGGVLADPTI